MYTQNVTRKDGHFDTVSNCFLSKSISVCKILYKNLGEKVATNLLL